MLVSPKSYYEENVMMEQQSVMLQSNYDNNNSTQPQQYLSTTRRRGSVVSTLQDILDLCSVWEARITPFSPVHNTLDATTPFDEVITSSPEVDDYEQQLGQFLVAPDDMNSLASMTVMEHQNPQQALQFLENSEQPETTAVKSKHAPMCISEKSSVKQEALVSLSMPSCSVSVRCARARDWNPFNDITELYCLPYKFYWKIAIDQAAMPNTDHLAVLLVRESDWTSMPEAIHCEITNVATHNGTHYFAIKVHFTTSSFMHKKSLFRIVMQNAETKSNMFVSDAKMIYSRRPREGVRKSNKRAEFDKEAADEEQDNTDQVKIETRSSNSSPSSLGEQGSNASSKRQAKKLKREAAAL